MLVVIAFICVISCFSPSLSLSHTLLFSFLFISFANVVSLIVLVAFLCFLVRVMPILAPYKSPNRWNWYRNFRIYASYTHIKCIKRYAGDSWPNISGKHFSYCYYCCSIFFLPIAFNSFAIRMLLLCLVETKVACFLLARASNLRMFEMMR